MLDQENLLLEGTESTMNRKSLYFSILVKTNTCLIYSLYECWWDVVLCTWLMSVLMAMSPNRERRWWRAYLFSSGNRSITHRTIWTLSGLGITGDMWECVGVGRVGEWEDGEWREEWVEREWGVGGGNGVREGERERERNERVVLPSSDVGMLLKTLR